MKAARESGPSESEAAATPVACPICGDGPVRTHFAGTLAGLSPAAIGAGRRQVGTGHILRCAACGFAFPSRRPDAGELASLYRVLDSSAYDAEISGRRRTARRHAQILARHAAGGRLLDVGCASGLFLELVTARGWDALGVEPSEALSREARNRLGGRVQVLSTTLEDAALPERSFDAVTLWDVLEHAPDPIDFLSRCAVLLRPGGILLLNVPDIASLPARLLGSRWPLLLPEHMSYFTRASIEECAARAGLTAIRFGRRPAWFSIDYLFSRLGQHAIGGARLMRRFADVSGLGRVNIPIPMGELFAVLRR